MEQLTETRDRAKAAGDMETLALVREISRLHWVLLKTHQVVDFTLHDYGDSTRVRVKELRGILDKEPLIIKRRAVFVRPALGPDDALEKIARDFDR